MAESIAVALSVYKTDKLIFLKEAIDSILIQNVDFKLFIEVDGYVYDDVYIFLSGLSSYKNVVISFNKENLGLATRLNEIIDKAIIHGGFTYLARMDADDISHSSRFIEQVSFLNQNEKIDVVGSDIIEISESGDEVFYKEMDNSHNVMYERIIKKCPFNHPTVMFRMSLFEEGFRYKPELMNTQDYYLWVDLLYANKIFSNINKPLLYFRVNKDFHSRRGVNKAINDFKSRLYAFKKLNNHSLSNYFHVVALLLLRVSPVSLKKIIYKKLR